MHVQHESARNLGRRGAGIMMRGIFDENSWMLHSHRTHSLAINCYYGHTPYPSVRSNSNNGAVRGVNNNQRETKENLSGARATTDSTSAVLEDNRTKAWAALAVTCASEPVRAPAVLQLLQALFIHVIPLANR